MERQVKEYGAKAFKFYNVRYDYGEPFHGVSTARVVPVFEKAPDWRPHHRRPQRRARSVSTRIGTSQTWDMDGAAADFPDINFIIFHVGLPFIDEVAGSWCAMQPLRPFPIAATLDLPCERHVSLPKRGQLRLVWRGQNSLWRRITVWSIPAGRSTPSGISSYLKTW